MLSSLSNRDQIEKAYVAFSELLENAKIRISSLSTTNQNFVSHQEEYKNHISVQINKIAESLADMKKNAIWDKLVIAFIGVTNAGKSTIIETFRILFDEPERKMALRMCPSGVDGRIIGDGRADFTRAYKEYSMSIGGREFVLIDVPGIEGNEGAVRDEILKALGKAHCVFYVQGEGKKPDAATVEKIKAYLKDWVKVYSIFNVKGSAYNYDEENERSVFKTHDIAKVELEIVKSMRDSLGANYADNISLQARLALCANAKFSIEQQDLIGEQKDLMYSFGTSTAMFDFSNFSEITNVVSFLSTHFSDEILEAQRKKLYKLHVEAFKELSEINKLHVEAIDLVLRKFNNCRHNVNGYFEATQKMIKMKLRQEIDDMFNKLETKGCEFIDSGMEGDILINAIEKEQKRLTSKVENNFKALINIEVNKLKQNVENELKRLKESFSVSSMNSGFSASFSMDLSKVISELEFGLGDLFNWGMLLGGAFYTGWLIVAGANWWNPVGWGLAALGALFAIFGDSKEDKAKAKLREKITEAKNDFFSKEWFNITYKVYSELNNKSERFDGQMLKIIKDFKMLKEQMENVMKDIINNSQKFR